MNRSAASSRFEPLSVASPHSDGRLFGVLMALYFLILYPILRANRYYNDDLKRALVGHTGWDSNGRPLTTLLMKLLQCYDGALVDISPLTQILAIAVLAWLGVLIARRYAIRSLWMAALVTFPLGAQPFYLENLSYKFDSLSMSLAMLLALLPILTLGDNRRGWWLGVLALFSSLCFYQPAINVTLVFILLDIIVAQLQDAAPRQWLRQFCSRLLQVGLTMLLYQLVVGVHIHGWVGRESRKIHSFGELPLIAKNIADFYRFICASFDLQWQVYFLPLLVALAIFPWVVSFRYALQRRAQLRRWRFAALLAGGALLPVAALFCIAGPMLLLLKPELEPRVMMGVGALLVAALIVMQAALARWQRSTLWTLATGCMLALGMCSLASAYGNALVEQKAYEDHIAENLADDLADLESTHDVRGFLLDGSIGFAPVTSHVAVAFPMIRLLVSPYISSTDRFHTTDFLMYYVVGLTNIGRQIDPASRHAQEVTLTRALAIAPWRTTAGYTLRVVDDTAVVTLHPATTNGR